MRNISQNLKLYTGELTGLLILHVEAAQRLVSPLLALSTQHTWAFIPCPGFNKPVSINVWNAHRGGGEPLQFFSNVVNRRALHARMPTYFSSAVSHFGSTPLTRCSASCCEICWVLLAKNVPARRHMCHIAPPKHTSPADWGSQCTQAWSFASHYHDAKPTPCWVAKCVAPKPCLFIYFCCLKASCWRVDFMYRCIYRRHHLCQWGLKLLLCYR